MVSTSRSVIHAQTVRNVGLLEKYHITRHALGLDSGVIVSAKYFLGEGKTPLDKMMLYPALAQILQHHRALSVQVHGELTRTPMYTRLDEIDLSRVVKFHDEDSNQLQSVMESYFLQPFKVDNDCQDPLWRLGVLRDNTIIFAYHHGIGDGQSGLAFHRALLTALNNPNATDSNCAQAENIVSIPVTLPLVPPVEEATDLSVSFTKACKEISSLFAPLSLTPGASAWTGRTVATEAALHNSVHLWELTPAEAKNLTELCRGHGSTLTSLFHTLAVSIISRLIEAETNTKKNREYKTISTFVPISLRRFTGAPPTAICNHVSTYHSYPYLVKSMSDTKSPPPPSFSWEACAKFSIALRQGVNSSREEIGMLKFLFGRYKEFIEGKLGKKRDAGFELSNIGRFPAPIKQEVGGSPSDGQPNWGISTMYFAQSDPICGAAIKMNVVGSPSGSVGLSVTWGKGAVDDNFAQAFVSQFKEALYAMLENAAKADL